MAYCSGQLDFAVSRECIVHAAPARSGQLQELRRATQLDGTERLLSEF
jgi:hypothetical protein